MSRVNQIKGCREGAPNRGTYLYKSLEGRKSVVFGGNCQWFTEAEMWSAKGQGGGFC